MLTEPANIFGPREINGGKLLHTVATVQALASQCRVPPETNEFIYLL